MRNVLRACAIMSVVTFPAQAEDTHGQLKAHDHGHGTLNVAIEGATMIMELEVPGADIVGFEHTATSEEDKLAIETATETLKRPLRLFVINADAECQVEEASVRVVGSEAHDDKTGKADKHEHEYESARENEHDHENRNAEAVDAHGEFHGKYRVTCAKPAAIGTFTFAYFDKFQGAQSLEVNVITELGQGRYHVDRNVAVINLKGLI